MAAAIPTAKAAIAAISAIAVMAVTISAAGTIAKAEKYWRPYIYRRCINGRSRIYRLAVRIGIVISGRIAGAIHRATA